MDVRKVLKIVMSKLKFHFIIDEKCTNNKYTVVRAHMGSSQEAHAFISEIERVTLSKFIHFYETPNPVQLVFRKKWICQHSGYRKKKNSKRNANCKVFVDICIKVITHSAKCRDPYLNLSKPLQCVIKLNLDHSHNNNTPDMLKMLRASSQAKKQFQDYFNSGMTVAEAGRLHESKVLVIGGEALLMNAASNPSQAQQHHLYHIWRKGKGDRSCEPFKKLLEKLHKYESEGATVKYHRMHPWSVLVVTSVMKRAQSLLSSQDVIFVTSTSDCGDLSYTSTMLLTTTKVGAIPIAVMFHQNQSIESYQSAFTLLIKTFPSCFGEKEGPSIFITEDLTPMKNALRSVWRSSQQLLSHYHVRHAEWRWLMSTDSGVEMNDCQAVMKHFEAVMYAEDELELQKARENILILHDKFSAFVARFENFFERKEEWVLLYRLSHISQNIKTHGFCASTIRILKDVILYRTKSLKIVALVEFYITALDLYLSKKLLGYAHNRVSDHYILYSTLSSKMTETSEADVQQIDEQTYLVPSSTKKNYRYIVEAKSGYCTCHSSKTGAFCKHQGLLRKHSKLNLPDAPVLSSTDRCILEELALGDKCPKDNFILDFSVEEKTYTDDFQYVKHCEKKVEIERGFDSIQRNQFTSDSQLAVLDFNVEEADTDDSQYVDHCEKKVESERDFDSIHHNQLATPEEKSSFLQEINRLLEFDIDSANLRKLTAYLAKIRNSTQLNETLSYINSSISEMR